LALDTALRRARWTIFWERLWPALATLVTAAGLFLAVSWLGLWLWLPPLARAAVVLAFAILTLAAAVPFIFVRVPVTADGLRRLDRSSGLPHRPATAIVDNLAVTSSDSYSLALWNAHVERTRAAAQTLRAGWPSPRVSARDPYALRALVLIACIATFVAAGGERWKRIAAAFDWQGVVLPANFRVDAWVTPPAYTGKPPIILAGIHPGDTARAADAASEPVTVPAGSTLVVRATGKLNINVSGSGGVTAATDATHAPSGTEEHRFKIASTGTATLRGAGDDLTWAFNAIADKPPTIALTKDPEQQNRGSLMLSYRVEDDYGATEALPATEMTGAEAMTETYAATARGAGLCVGHPFDGVEVRAIAFGDGPISTLRDARILPTGEIGELIVRGPHISPAYADDPDSTRKNKVHDPDGTIWHRLGDAGYVDAQGRVWVCGRAGHRVTTASGTLYPLMCEPIFDAHPRVRRSGLVGVGDLAVICIELAGSATDHDALRAELLALAAAHATTRSIRHVLFRPHLPVDPRHNSKIERPALAKWAAIELRREQRWRPFRQLAATV